MKVIAPLPAAAEDSGSSAPIAALKEGSRALASGPRVTRPKCGDGAWPPPSLAAAPQRRRQPAVGIVQRGDLRRHLRRQFPLLQQRARRGAVRLGEQHVECDRGRAGRPQPLHQVGHLAARPRPLAEPAQAVVVDIDDAHADILVSARLPALVLVEHIVAQGLQRQGIEQQRAAGCKQENGKNRGAGER
jgi:hypothetical protein